MVFELLDAGEQVIVLGNVSTGFRWAVPEGAPLIVHSRGPHVASAFWEPLDLGWFWEPLDLGCRSTTRALHAVLATLIESNSTDFDCAVPLSIEDYDPLRSKLVYCGTKFWSPKPEVANICNDK